MNSPRQHGQPKDRRALVAVDLGAQSCRICLLRWSAEGPRIQVVHRIPNAPILRNGELRWNLPAISDAADEGLRRCAAIADEGIAAIGVTGWAVDYVRLDPEGRPIADPFCYRDARNARAMEVVHRITPPARLYALTGIQVFAINTLYQLVADTVAGVPGKLRWLNLPEYMLYRWGARPVAEYTNATHTALVALNKQQWCAEVFEAAGLDLSAAPEIVAPGTVVGQLRGPLSLLPALRNAALIAPACHDTASAIAGIPATGEDWAFISSGTWSLVGTLLEKPCAGPEAAQHNFTNEGGVGGTTCFLRNVNGMWLLNQCMETWSSAGASWTTEGLIEAAARLSAPSTVFDVDDPELVKPGNMPERIAARMNCNGENVSHSAALSAPEITNAILHSLAARYATVLHQAETLTGRHLRRLYVVGGGSRNSFLNQLTARATGLEVICGATESSTLGNFAVQLAAQAAKPHDPSPSHEAISAWAGALARSVEVADSAVPRKVPGNANQFEEDRV